MTKPYGENWSPSPKYAQKLIHFIGRTNNYFILKLNRTDSERYHTDRDIRCILDKTASDIITAMCYLSAELLKLSNRDIPTNYRDTMLACHDIVGPVVQRLSEISRRRNELVHDFMDSGWANIEYVRVRLDDMEKFTHLAFKFIDREFMPENTPQSPGR
jgi:hypothetical protein